MAKIVDEKSFNKIKTILGGDFDHVKAEKRRLVGTIKANPLAASLFFNPLASPAIATKTMGFFRPLLHKAQQGQLTDQEKAFIEEQSKFSTEQGKFNALLGRQEEVVKQREAIEASRRRAPGRTQTILTRRE